MIIVITRSVVEMGEKGEVMKMNIREKRFFSPM
jgi:hypothetical protein